MDDHSLVNQILIAMPSLDDSRFNRSLALICEHSSEGALGVVINQPINLTMAEVFSQLAFNSRDSRQSSQKVFYGGPVQQDRGLVLHQGIGDWEYTLTISKDLGLTSSKDIILALAEDQGPAKNIFVLGYAGWGEGQLEQEIINNDWLTLPANTDILFNIEPQYKWESALNMLGVNLTDLSSECGHA